MNQGDLPKQDDPETLLSPDSLDSLNFGDAPFKLLIWL